MLKAYIDHVFFKALKMLYNFVYSVKGYLLFMRLMRWNRIVFYSKSYCRVFFHLILEEFLIKRSILGFILS
ncbi:hypothetical protein BN1088_390003 [Sphingobacterium sp. PM2-P1-29]|nr:hypothetical protein BN1088_390003 [Sphingobacterium sp. PM2-P1-29]